MVFMVLGSFKSPLCFTFLPHLAIFHWYITNSSSISSDTIDSLSVSDALFGFFWFPGTFYSVQVRCQVWLVGLLSWSIRWAMQCAGILFLIVLNAGKMKESARIGFCRWLEPHCFHVVTVSYCISSPFLPQAQVLWGWDALWFSLKDVSH